MKLENEVYLKQRKELAELFGLETRNKYEIYNEHKESIGFAAEQGKGFWRFIARMFLGHWRTFTIKIFNHNREHVLDAYHPFRWFFQRLEITTANKEYIGAIQQRFSILSKKFDIESRTGEVIFKMRSPIWRIWTFPVYQHDSEVARIEKKWGGFLKEAFLDADNFRVKFGRVTQEEQKQILLAAALFIDLQYFEKKADSSISFSD